MSRFRTAISLFKVRFIGVRHLVAVNRGIAADIVNLLVDCMTTSPSGLMNGVTSNSTPTFNCE